MQKVDIIDKLTTCSYYQSKSVLGALDNVVEMFVGAMIEAFGLYATSLPHIPIAMEYVSGIPFIPDSGFVLTESLLSTAFIRGFLVYKKPTALICRL